MVDPQELESHNARTKLLHVFTRVVRFPTQSVIDTVSGADVCCEVLAGIARGWGWMAARGTLHPVPSTSAYPWVHEDGDRDPRQGLQA